MANDYKTKQAFLNQSGASRRIFFRIPVIIVMMMMLAGNGWGQLTVFYDDFNRVDVSPGGTPSMTYTATNTGAGTEVIESTLATGTVPYLKISNGNPAGRSYLTGPLSTFSSPYSTTLSSNPGLVTWSFNARHNRNSTLSGFDATNYGYAVVLVASSSDLSTANGYAVVSGGSGSNVYRLVKFTGGLFANSSVTNLVTGMTQTDRRDYMSIKVTYDPFTGTWSYYDRTDGPSGTPAWADPSAGTYTLRGTSTDATYTGIAMSSFGYFWNYSTSAGNNSYFDNFGVSVTEVLTPTLIVVPSSLNNFNYVIGSGPSATQSYTLSGANLDGSTVTASGSANYEVATDLNPTFSASVNIPYTAPTLNSTTVYVRLIAGLPVGNYNSEIIANTGGSAAPVNVTCNGFVLPTASTYTWNGSTDTDWQVATNWTPNRITPASNDILQFNNGISNTITNVPVQTIGQFLLSNNTSVELQSVGPVTLTISGGSGVDLNVPGGSELNIIQLTNAIIIDLPSGKTGSIGGSMTFSNAAHKLLAADISGITFQNGSVFTAGLLFTSNAFGTTNLNSVVFANGSTYVYYAGSNPFGATAPNSVVVWQTGSTYVHKSTGNPSFANRIYANFELDQVTGAEFTSSSPLTFDNLIVTTGTWTLGIKANFTINNNITVAPGATLNLNPTIAGTIILSAGSTHSINGGTITFGAFQDVTANNNLSFGTGTITFTSGASLITNGTVSGNVIMERSIGAWTDAFHGWHLLSSPVASQAIAPAFTDPTPANYDFYKWDEFTNMWLNQKDGANGITTFIPGTGYLVAYSTTGIKQFNGVLNNANVTATGLTISGGANSGWNLVGNPFACALKWNDGINWTVPGNIAGTAKIWNEATAAYVDVAPGGFIPALNGMMVQVLSGSPASLTIPAAARVHDATAWYKSEQGSITLVAYDRVNNTAQQSIIRLNDLASEGYDAAYDSRFLAGYAPQFFSVSGSEYLSTNTLPDLGGNRVIEMGFIKNSAGEFSIGLNTDELLPGLMVYLTDKKTGMVTVMSQGMEYTFTASEGDDVNRFLVHFSALGIEDPIAGRLYDIYANAGNIYIASKESVNADVIVSNLIGQVVLSGRTDGNNFTAISASALQNGIYLVTVKSGSQVICGKVMISR